MWRKNWNQNRAVVSLRLCLCARMEHVRRTKRRACVTVVAGRAWWSRVRCALAAVRLPSRSAWLRSRRRRQRRGTREVWRDHAARPLARKGAAPIRGHAAAAGAVSRGPPPHPPTAREPFVRRCRPARRLEKLRVCSAPNFPNLSHACFFTNG